MVLSQILGNNGVAALNLNGVPQSYRQKRRRVTASVHQRHSPDHLPADALRREGGGTEARPVRHIPTPIRCSGGRDLDL